MFNFANTNQIMKELDKIIPYLSSYLYDAAGERTLKLQGANQVMLINGQQQFNFFDLNNFTLYTSPYMVMTPKSYTKHYYIEDERVISKIGGGMAHNIVSIDALVSGFDIDNINSYKEKTEKNINMMYRDFETLHVNAEVDIHPDIHFWLHEAQDLDKHEKFIYFYHKDHLGSSTQITDLNADVIHHIEYMPYGENFFEMRDTWQTPYKFNGKELDNETGLYYYGARYYTPEISVWLSVDPMADKRPNLSPYNYCQNNPVILIDPTGALDELVITGPEADAATKQLQKSTNLTLTRDPKTKIVTATGNPITADDQKLLDVINSTDVTVTVTANNSGGNSGGAFMGNVVSKSTESAEISTNNKPFKSSQFQYEKTMVNAKQTVNPWKLKMIDLFYGGKPGQSMLHEVTEAFQGGLISMKTGISALPAIKGNSTYNIYLGAHNRATRQPGDGLVDPQIFNNIKSSINSIKENPFTKNIFK